MLAWHPSTFHVNILYYSDQLMHIVVEVVKGGGGRKFSRSFVYGHHDRTNGKELWRKLIEISANILGAWVILGDFNAI